MAILLKARVKETSVTAGTGTLNLDGAVSGFRTFLSAFGSGASCYYTIIDGLAWEIGIGVVTSGSPNTLSRLVILDSSASGAALTLSGGTKSVFCEGPAEAYSDKEERILRTPTLTTTGTFLLISGTAYFVYLGKTTRPLTIASLEAHVSTIGAGAQTAEVGLFSTPLPPNKAGQTLTKIVATGTVDALTGTGMKRNTASFAQAVPVGTHLWGAIRTAMATTQPTCVGVASDMSQGHILTTTAQGALTGLTTTAGGLVAIATANVGPALAATVD